MASNYVLGFLVLLCYYFLLIFAEYGTECPKSFDCGKLGKDIHYPFTNTRNLKCGLAITGCDDDPDADKEILLEDNQISYKIERIYQKYEYSSIVISYREFQGLFSSKNCSAFNYIMPMHILFRCSKTAPEYHSIYNCSDHDIYFSSKLSDECLAAQLAIVPLSIIVDPFASSSELLIDVTLSDPCFGCYYAGRVCVRDKENISCVDANVLNPPTENNKGDSEKVNKGDSGKVKIIGLSIGLAGVTIAFFVTLLLYKRRHNSSSSQNQPRNIDSAHSSDINIESGTVYFGVPVFSYEELQEATDNFDQARELGEGGFGTVYHGKLRDGREVAVKRLYERNYRPVESFINEIQILTRLRHTNLVALYGCTSRHSRELLLVYEYIPNGTVSYHLHGDNAKPGLMPWPVRMKIAIETASALTYLHASDIIHRDVKTSNILLNNNFSVKVADFGLSRLFPTDVTHVSTAPQGTPGYVDPDYRICYQLTSKSDVYSFGVVLVELISSLPAVDMTRDRDEIRLANLAIRKIQRGAFSELVDPSLGFQSDDKLKRMITSVAELAFQCLQGDKELRPSMGEVLEVLQRIESWKDVPGNLEGFDVNGAGLSHSYAHPSIPNTLMKPQRLHQTL